MSIVELVTRFRLGLPVGNVRRSLAWVCDNYMAVAPSEGHNILT